MRVKGKLTTWNDDKGFGFITPMAGGKQVFVHIKAFPNRNRRPQLNQQVTYSLSADKKGRPCAKDATLTGDRIPEKAQRKSGSVSVVVAASFLAMIGVAVFTAKIPLWLLALYLVASLITFITYALDKSAARKGAQRVPENTLHLMSLAGGWPGALVAQQQFRHKSRKRPFRAVFWITVLLNGGLFFWLLTPTGADTLKTLFAGIS